jgi:hypothetical protein
MLDIIFFRDFEEVNIERKCYNFVSLMSDTGGFAGTVTLVVGLLIAGS